MLIDVVSVEVLDNYHLLLTFENGEVRNFDMNRYIELKPYNCLKGTSQFKRAKVENGTVVWPGEIDMAPENLYHESVFIRSVSSDSSRQA
ncbi:hypothetical protein CHISP_2432 [Chitinispirillum alkaliphilum]|nr:hypothetical protein CHISP_2432 [Chitinispirillum alkaliphilum]